MAPTSEQAPSSASVGTDPEKELAPGSTSLALRAILRPCSPAPLSFALPLRSGLLAGGSGPLPGTQTKNDRAAWRRLLHWPGACEISWRQNGSGAGVAGVWPIARGGSLVAID